MAASADCRPSNWRSRSGSGLSNGVPMTLSCPAAARAGRFGPGVCDWAFATACLRPHVCDGALGSGAGLGVGAGRLGLGAGAGRLGLGLGAGGLWLRAWGACRVCCVRPVQTGRHTGPRRDARRDAGWTDRPPRASRPRSGCAAWCPGRSSWPARTGAWRNPARPWGNRAAAPSLAILFGRQILRRLQMPFQHLEFLAVFQTNDIAVEHRLLG